jgi:hypothetical protein
MKQTENGCRVKDVGDILNEIFGANICGLTTHKGYGHVTLTDSISPSIITKLQKEGIQILAIRGDDVAERLSIEFMY